MNQRPFGLGDQALCSWQQSPLSDALRDRSSEGEAYNYSQKKKKKLEEEEEEVDTEGEGFTHTHSSAVHEKVLRKSRLQLLLYEVLTSAWRGEEPTL